VKFLVRTCGSKAAAALSIFDGHEKIASSYFNIDCASIGEFRRITPEGWLPRTAVRG